MTSPAKKDTLAMLTGDKKSQSEAHYVKTTSSANICHTCSAYENPSATTSTCSKVIGTVASGGTCDLWTPRNEQTPPDPTQSHTLALKIHTGTAGPAALTRILTIHPEQAPSV